MTPSNIAYRTSGSAAARSAALSKLDKQYPDLMDLGKASEHISKLLNRTVTRGYLQQICCPKCENIGKIITSPTGFFKKMLSKDEVAEATEIIRNMPKRGQHRKHQVQLSGAATLTVQQLKTLLGHELDKLITPVVEATEVAAKKAQEAEAEISLLEATNERLIAQVAALEQQVEEARNQERWAAASFKTAEDALKQAKSHINELLRFATSD